MTRPRLSIFKLVQRAMSSGSSPITDSITTKVKNAFSPVEFQIFNDSHKHSHHAAMRGSSNIAESHFRLVIVSEEFKNKTQPARHRMVYSLLDEELKRPNGIHALQLSTKTPEEYQKLVQQLQ